MNDKFKIFVKSHVVNNIKTISELDYLFLFSRTEDFTFIACLKYFLVLTEQ